MLNCKLFCLGKLTCLHSDRFTQNHFSLHHKYGFAVTALHMYVDRCVIIAVEEESKSVFDEYSRTVVYLLAIL